MPKILVVDDDLAVLATLGLGLRQAGYHVLQVDSGALALQICRREKPDLAVLDIRMPDMSGLELAQAIRAETSTPFIFLSAHSDGSQVRSALEAGALGYLVKPVEVAQIIPAIEVALKRADELVQLRLGNADLVDEARAHHETGIAVGMVMARHHLDRAAAFEMLRANARACPGGIAELARRLADGEDIPLTEA